MRYNPILLVFFTVCFISAKAQHTPDTLSLSIAKADGIFLQKNLQLLAEHFNIDINTALAQQAKYYPNPVLNTDQNIYDGKFFRHTTTNGVHYGQIYIQLQQLIVTGGKRNKLITLANDQTLSAQQQFEDLLRNLRFMLHSNMNDLYRLQQIQKIYNTEVLSLTQMNEGMDAQFKAGNIAEKDNVRVKALLYSLQSDRVDNERQMLDLQKEIKLQLQLGTDTSVLVQMNEPLVATNALLPLGALIDSAKINRPDVQLAQNNLFTQQHNIIYQKALAVPDVTIGTEYDQSNSYMPNYYGLAVSLPLPLFNKNKGNIKAAEAASSQAKVVLQQSQNTVEQEVANAYSKYQLSSNVLNANTSKSLDENYDRLLQNMMNSYKQRQVGLVEFIDFFGAWKATKLQKLQQENNLRNALDEISFTAATQLK